MNSPSPHHGVTSQMRHLSEEFARMGFLSEKTEAKASLFDEPTFKNSDFPTKLCVLETAYWKSMFSLLEVEGTITYYILPPVFKSIVINDLNSIKTHFSDPTADTETRITKEGATILTFACCGANQMSNNERKRRLQVIKFLIGRGADVNSRCSVAGVPRSLGFSNLTPLYIAVKEKNQPLVRTLLANGASPSIELTPHNLAPIHIAAHNGHPELCEMLLRAGADINHRDADGNSPLILACSRGLTAVVYVLLDWPTGKKADVNLCNHSRKLTALHAGIYSRSVEIVRLLLRHGANVNAETIEGHTPLDMAIFMNANDIRNLLNKQKSLASTFNKSKGRKPVQEYLLPSYGDRTPLAPVTAGNFLGDMKYLVDHGVDVNAPSVHGTTPLCIAVASGSMQAINFLLKSNAEINVESVQGLSPLHFAVDMGYKHIVNILLDNGAKIDNLRRPILVTAAQLPPTYESGNEDLEEKRASIAQFLISKGAPIDEKYEDLTPLEHANKSENTEVAEVINRQNEIYRCIQNNNVVELKKNLNNGAFPNCRSVKFGTPLQYATVKNYLNVVSCLIENGADVNFAPAGNVTPLHYAAKFNNHAIAFKLLTCGATFDIRTVKSGKTPLEICLENNPHDCETARLLKILDSLFSLGAAELMDTMGIANSLIVKGRNSKGDSVECIWNSTRKKSNKKDA